MRWPTSSTTTLLSPVIMTESVISPPIATLLPDISPIEETELPDPTEDEDLEDKENESNLMNESLLPTISTADKVANLWLRDADNFTHGINYLIISGILHGDKISSNADIPNWIVNHLSEMWHKEKITDITFYDALQYLLDKQIIK